MTKSKAYFRFKKEQRGVEFLPLAIILTLFVSALYVESGSFLQMVILISLAGSILFFTRIAYLFKEDLSLSNTSIIIKKWPNKAEEWRFDQLGSVIVREEMSAIDQSTQLVMTLIGDGITHKIYVSDINEPLTFLEIIDGKAQRHNFKIIYQNINGELVTAKALNPAQYI